MSIYFQQSLGFIHPHHTSPLPELHFPLLSQHLPKDLQLCSCPCMNWTKKSSRQQLLGFHKFLSFFNRSKNCCFSMALTLWEQTILRQKTPLPLTVSNFEDLKSYAQKVGNLSLPGRFVWNRSLLRNIHADVSANMGAGRDIRIRHSVTHTLQPSFNFPDCATFAFADCEGWWGYEFCSHSSFDRRSLQSCQTHKMVLKQTKIDHMSSAAKSKKQNTAASNFGWVTPRPFDHRHVRRPGIHKPHVKLIVQQQFPGSSSHSGKIRYNTL